MARRLCFDDASNGRASRAVTLRSRPSSLSCARGWLWSVTPGNSTAGPPAAPRTAPLACAARAGAVHACNFQHRRDWGLSDKGQARLPGAPETFCPSGRFPLQLCKLHPASAAWSRRSGQAACFWEETSCNCWVCGAQHFRLTHQRRVSTSKHVRCETQVPQQHADHWFLGAQELIKRILKSTYCSTPLPSLRYGVV